MKKLFFGLIGVVVLWIIAIFMDYPVIPYLKTDFYIKGETNPLSKKQDLGELDNTFFGLEIPDYFPENDQSFDLWFLSNGENQRITINNFSFELKDEKGEEKEKLTSILFWDGGSKEELSIDNYSIDKENEYVFIRSVYDVDNLSSFSMTISANFTIDNQLNKITKNLILEKKRTLQWMRFRFH